MSTLAVTSISSMLTGPGSYSVGRNRDTNPEPAEYDAPQLDTQDNGGQEGQAVPVEPVLNQGRILPENDAALSLSEVRELLNEVTERIRNTIPLELNQAQPVLERSLIPSAYV